MRRCRAPHLYRGPSMDAYSPSYGRALENYSNSDLDSVRAL